MGDLSFVQQQKGLTEEAWLKPSLNPNLAQPQMTPCESFCPNYPEAQS